MKVPAQTRFFVTSLIYATEILGIIIPALVSSSGIARAEWAFVFVTVGLYAATALLLLSRKGDDPRVVLFTYSGFISSLTVLLRFRPLGAHPTLSELLYLAVFCAVYLVLIGIGVHLAALIPRRNPIVVRHRYIIPGWYLAAVVLAIVGFLFEVDAAVHVFPWTLHFPPRVALITIVRMSWAAAGWFAVYLYASAARHDESTDGKRQALVVLGGILPWTLNVTATFVPAYRNYPLYTFVEAIVVLLVPIALLVSILRYHLFGASIIVRRGLIYGSTTGLLTAAIFIGGSILGDLTAHLLGIRPTIWWLAALFFVAGGFFQPLAQWIGRRVDARFFREKVELRRLQQTIIPELATTTVTGGGAEYLVRRVRDALALRSATLVLADEAREFYRVRAIDGSVAGGVVAQASVITSADLGAWRDLLMKSPPFARFDRSREPRELRAALDALSAEYVVAIRQNEHLTGLLLLGESEKGWQLDREDLDALEGIAHQASAMLENARLLDLAVHDGLTRLPRAQFALEQVRAEVERARRSFRPFALAVIDIDHFKSVNDSLGHQGGDAVLSGVVGRLRRNSRSIDLLARYGGDELLLFLPDTSPHGAASHAEDLRRAVAENEQVTISIGLCAVGAPADLADPMRLFKRADDALYAAKRAGRNRVAAWEPPAPGLISRAGA